MTDSAREKEVSARSAGGSGTWWLAALLLPIPVGLAVWRVVGLGYGMTDFAAHFVLDLLVSTCLVVLLSGPLRGRPPLPKVYAGLLLLLALDVGWLYLPAGFGTAAFLAIVVLIVGILLRLLREKLTLATFLRSEWMEEAGLGSGDVPEDAVYTPDPLLGGPARTWRRYVAFPILAGLLLAFVAVRVARPLDKRTEARAVLEAGEPFEIGRAFLKAATNGNAPLFTRERVLWFVSREARTTVMPQVADLFAAVKRASRDLDLQWIDLGTLQAVESRAGRPGEMAGQNVQTYGGRVVAYLEEPETPPQGLAWVDASRPHRGFYAWMLPLEVTLERTDEGLRVVGLAGDAQVRLHRP